jgi:hypothetical protein
MKTAFSLSKKNTIVPTCDLKLVPRNLILQEAKKTNVHLIIFVRGYVFCDQTGSSHENLQVCEKKNGINTEIKQTGDFSTPTSSSCRNSSSWSHFSAESAPAGLRNRNIPVWSIYVCAWRREQEAAGPVHRWASPFNRFANGLVVPLFVRQHTDKRVT